MQYRPEIDGLRAVAVLPVILFHGGFHWFSGGFIGVDVFFVISGYLITTILLSDLENNRFSISQFYERRARRILPALFAVMIACIPFAYAWMLPSQLLDFAQSIVAVIFFVSNILFWREAGYFAPVAELKPLLHTWSLAVEEQYYLLFPIVLALLWKFKRRVSFIVIIAFTISSFVLAEWASRTAPGANFYLAPTRAWELFAGSICAFLTYGRGQRSSNFLSATGLALIVASIILYDASTPFPSSYTLAPVVGTSLIILYASHTTWTAKLLSVKIVVGIGLISYSAYLWHQPLFSFARLRSLDEPTPAVMGLLACLSLGLAWVSWRFIEAPFRYGERSTLPTRKMVFTTSAIASLVFIAIGSLGLLKQGFPHRSTGVISYQDLEARIAPNHGLSADCDASFNKSPNCYTFENPNVLLWGDSFAMHLAKGIVASDPDVAMQQHTMSSCAPVLRLAHIGNGKTNRWADRCIRFNDEVLGWLRENRQIELVILSSRFDQLIENDIQAADGASLPSRSIESIVAGIRDTVNEIRKSGTQVIIVSPPPRADYDIGQCLVKSVMFDRDLENCDFASGINTSAFEMLRQVTELVPVHWLQNEICNEKKCFARRSDTFIYRDDKHLSNEGSVLLGIQNSWLSTFRGKSR
ncbi:acyltransferase family protein [Sulfitobacter pontiacus]|uniref:acyltransferase family protein n=1 Tax=Sulfitobacter pontiacus TaxID=60137 RepID=UPI0015E05937|nr:acyltransferase family protein [Sulfitobacter pontiacus]QLL42439.1 acyltransferase family protein [Sulfitobacter pontiacus]